MGNGQCFNQYSHVHVMGVNVCVGVYVHMCVCVYRLEIIWVSVEENWLA